MTENSVVLVLVLYKEKIAETPSYLLLKEAIREKDNLYMLVYDNSPEKQVDELFNEEKVKYIHNAGNPGLAAAYNQGVVYFNQVAGDLLLLLDQDTKMNSNYLINAAQLALNASVGAYVPTVYSGKQRISPVFSDTYVSVGSEKPAIGISERRVMAINSGTLLTKDALTKIGRFNEAFPLDFLDHWLFWTLDQNGLQVMILEAIFSHDLSILRHEFVSVDRYLKLLTAETNYYQNYDVANLNRHKQQLFFRTIKQFVFVKNRVIWKTTWREFYGIMRGK